MITNEEMSNLEYILIDIGNVIFHDYPVELVYSQFVYEQLLLYRKISITEFLSMRKRIILSGRLYWHEQIGFEICGEDWIKVRDQLWRRTLEVWKELTIPIEGAIETIQRLSRIKPVVIAANQPIETMETLELFGLVPYFKEIILDSMIGHKKPDSEFYEYIIDRLNVPPDKILMIGDRYENDVLPAAKLGIKTAWIRFIPQQLTLKDIDFEWSDLFYSGYCDIANYNYAEQTQSTTLYKANYEANTLEDLFNRLQ